MAETTPYKRINPQDLAKYGRRSTILPLKGKVELKLENGELMLAESSFKNSDGEEVTFPAIICKVDGRERSDISLSYFCSKSASGYKVIDKTISSENEEIVLNGLCDEQATYQEIYKELCDNKTTELEVKSIGFWYDSKWGGKRKGYLRVIGKKE